MNHHPGFRRHASGALINSGPSLAKVNLLAEKLEAKEALLDAKLQELTQLQSALGQQMTVMNSAHEE